MGHNKPLLPGLPVEAALHTLRREICSNTVVSIICRDKGQGGWVGVGKTLVSSLTKNRKEGND